MRLLNKKLVLAVLKLQPKQINFQVEHGKYILCEITANDNSRGIGVAICSPMDKKDFTVTVGKRKAAGRAVKALINRDSSERIRKEFREFPNTWTKAQIENVMAYANTFQYLSRFDR